MQQIKDLLPGTCRSSTPHQKSCSENNSKQCDFPASIDQVREPSDIEIEDNNKRRQRDGYAPNPFCRVCHGVGFVYPRKQDGRIDWANIVPCNQPNCLAEARQHWKQSGEYLELKGISTRLQTFDQFKPLNGTNECLDAFKALAFGESKKPFLLCYGGVGNGKTHLCQALTIVLNQRGIDAYYYRVPDLLKTLRAAIDTHDSDDWVKSLSNVQALVLDDFGLEAQTMWSTANIEDIIDARWQEKRITVMTTNKNIIDLPARIQSRFRDTDLSVYVLNAGKDYRTAKR